VVTKGEKKKELTILRRFTLQRGDDKRNCLQFQYVGWPDHGVPEDEDDFIKFTEKVDEYNKNGKPLLVHCSAGIGRSGTFCAIHSYVRYLKQYYAAKNDPNINLIPLPDINVPQRLIELRRDRPKMIQTKEQYEFVYRAIYKVFEDLFKEFAKRDRENKEKEE